MTKPIISATDLFAIYQKPTTRIVDCRFSSLVDTEVGRKDYEMSHIPHAIYAHLDEDLSGPPITNKGRHPLPTPSALAETFGHWGIDSDTTVVAYDDANGAIASRLWWLLRYMGHDNVVVLDGGWQAWLANNFPTTAEIITPMPTTFQGDPHDDWVVTIDEVEQMSLLIDSRAPARYRGEVEPLDPVAGHIPGAVNYFFQNNWSDGKYFDRKKIRENMQALLGDIPPTQTAVYCGSGVTACVNLLAMEYAGIPLPKLYAGSWSEWSRSK
jgi:thiosulfate/3-mercaptopyruvate sulfurtransferase